MKGRSEMLEWLIGAAIVGTIAYVARGMYSSPSNSGGDAGPVTDVKNGEGAFTIDKGIFAIDDAATCKAIVDKWVSTLDAGSQAMIAKAISEGDKGVLETAASYQDGANPTLAKCIRAMKPNILPSEPINPIVSPFILNPLVFGFKPALGAGELRAALNTCMAGSGMSADLQNLTNASFDAAPTRAQITVIANKIRPVYPAVAMCLDMIPS